MKKRKKRFKSVAGMRWLVYDLKTGLSLELSLIIQTCGAQIQSTLTVTVTSHFPSPRDIRTYVPLGLYPAFAASINDESWGPVLRKTGSLKAVPFLNATIIFTGGRGGSG